MKKLIIPVLFAGLVGLATFSTVFVGSEEVVIYERVATTTVEVVEEMDVIDAAKAELERINTELDLEEQKLLEEIKNREERLEQIRETRMSF